MTSNFITRLDKQVEFRNVVGSGMQKVDTGQLWKALASSL